MNSLARNGWLIGLLFLGGLAMASAQEAPVTGRIELVRDANAGRQRAHRRSLDASNVVVWLTPLSETPETKVGGQPTPPGFRMVQKHISFDPHVLVVPVGAVVEFPNQDPFFHNVFSLFNGKRFDLGLYEAGGSRTVLFHQPGISYLFCNIHPEMAAVIVTVNTPYYGISDPSGLVTIPNVPPGRYQLQVWHEHSLPKVLKSLRREVTVSESSRSLGIIRVAEATELGLAHKNKYGRDYERPSSPAYTRP